MPKAVPSTADAARASDNVTVCVVPLTWTIPAVRSEPPDTVSSPSKEALTAPEAPNRSEEHTSELQSLMRISYAVFCLKKKNKNYTNITQKTQNTNVTSQNNQTIQHLITYQRQT